jgi:hypothetical protein
MAFEKLKSKLKGSSKSAKDYLTEDLVANPYSEFDFNDAAAALEKGISEQEIKDALLKKKAQKDAMERLRLKQEK